MRFLQQLRRLGPALLALAVLLASLAGAAHTHAGAASSGVAISEETPRAAGAASFDLDCALCAAAARLAQGTRLAFAEPPDLALARFHAHHAGDAPPPRVVLARREARAPPRHG